MTKDECRSKMGSVSGQMASARSSVASLDARIGRLWDAYRRLDRMKDSVSAQLVQSRGRLQGSTGWSGQRRREFDQVVSGEMAGADDAYVRGIDASLDEIRDAIRRLEDERASQNWLIGSLQRTYNQLTSWLDQALN